MLQATKTLLLVHMLKSNLDEPITGDQRALHILQTLSRTVTEGKRSVLMSNHVMDDVQELWYNDSQG